MGVGQRGACACRGRLMGCDALIRGLGGVVAFGHFRAVALFEHKFLLSEDHVREPRIEFPDLVEKFELGVS